MTNLGVFTIAGIKGKTVTAAPTAAGQVFRYDGTNLVPNYLSMFDLRSTVTGAATFGSGTTGCTSNQTLTWTAATDNLACTNISLPVGQITGTLAVGSGGTGATTLTGILKGNGTSAFTAATAGTDYSVPGGTENFTGTKTFSNSAFSMLGSSTGATTLTSANSSVNNYTLTLPAITDTLVGRTTTDTLTNKTWNGVVIDATYGGTGQTSYAVGDLLYASTTTALSRLPAGTSG
jgi:hypothetical protein